MIFTHNWSYSWASSPISPVCYTNFIPHTMYSEILTFQFQRLILVNVTLHHEWMTVETFWSDDSKLCQDTGTFVGMDLVFFLWGTCCQIENRREKLTNWNPAALSSSGAGLIILKKAIQVPKTGCRAFDSTLLKQRVNLHDSSLLVVLMIIIFST